MPTDDLRHYALFYRDADHLARTVAALPGPVVTAGEPVVAAVRPAAAVAVYRRIVRHRAGEPVTIVAEPDFGDRPAGFDNTGVFEAACNVALAGHPVTVVCAYPAGCPDRVRFWAGAAHPHLLTDAGPVPNPDWREPEALLSALAPAAPVPAPGSARRLHVTGSTGVHDLDPIRTRVRAALPGLPALVRADFVAAVNEILTNAYLHGAPPVDVALWAVADQVECRVTDRGPGLADPLAGYRPDRDDGRPRARIGLWLARQACDRIDMWHDEAGFTVRATTAVPATKILPAAGARARVEAAHTRATLLHRRYERP
ncbi:ATP-binding protein [Dactylosporangium sp. CS-047395]|uniref:ATP-binding protein n=1 Tax=Dactylosporangium sp. CS-047395 TaxID=3239936 RepID=UPI003D8B1B9E